MTTVCLHVGCFKTGTSYLQRTMAANRDALRDDGVLWPGASFGDQVRWANYVKTGRARTGGAHWSQIVDEIDAWDGRLAVVSMEFLSLADSEGVQRAVESLSRHRLKVVLTARDLARVVPAQWQESVQHQHVWSYKEYLSEITRDGRGASQARHHFRARHNWPGILSRWSAASPDDLTLLVVPPAGAPRGLLWERFASVLGVQADRFTEPEAVNESLGAASAEVLRYAAMSLNAGSYSNAAVRVKKRVLAKTLLAARKSDEPALALPSEYEDWAVTWTERLLAGLEKVGPTVVGDLDELMPRFERSAKDVVTDPSSLPVEQLLAAAGDGLMGMCAALARSEPAE